MAYTGAAHRVKKRRLARVVVLSLLALLLVAMTAIVPGLRRNAGGRPSGARLDRASRSQQFANGRFHNSAADYEVSVSEGLRDLKHGLFGGEQRVPPQSIPIVERHSRDYATEPASGLRITWMGHVSTLIEIDGQRILTDPVWSERSSPLSWIGPKRFHAPPISLMELPNIDIVLISHDHYDHLDRETVQALAERGTRFFVPLGIGAHLEAWGIPASQFSELDWGEEVEVGRVKFVATPARHYSGRNPLHANETLWASWVVVGPQHRVFYSGDSGYTDGFKAIGVAYGPFDVTLIKIGASDPGWATIHMSPEEAVHAHVDVRGKVLLPVHWGTFNLAFHSWDEPVERVVAASNAASVQVVVPKPGEFVDPENLSTVNYWWRGVK